MRPQSVPSSFVRSLAFRDILDRELDFVWNCLHRLGIPEHDLEREASEVFSRVKDALPRLDPTRRIHPWLAGIAYRVASDYGQRHPSFAKCDGEKPPSSDGVGENEECTVFRDALRKLDLQQRAMFILHVMYAYPLFEIAESCELSLEAAQSSLWLACSELIETLRRSGWKNDR